MYSLLNNVPAPERIKLSEKELALAKIRILQKALVLQEQLLRKELSEETVNEIEDAINGLDFDLNPLGMEEEDAAPEYLTVRDVSKLTGLAPQVVRRHLANGKYIGYQVAGENSSWRVDPKQFQSYPNWAKFLKDRKKEFERSGHVARLALKLWEEEGKGPTEVKGEK